MSECFLLEKEFVVLTTIINQISST